MKYLPQPEIEFVAGQDDVIRLVHDFRIRYGGREWNMRHGFQSDGVSSPRGTWNIVAKYEGDTLPGGLTHDANYAGELLPRVEADNLLYDMLRANGVSWLKAQAMYWAVRACGWSIWRQHTDESVQEARRYVSVHTVNP